MHERSIAADLVRAAGVTAFEEGGTVRAMHIRIGGLSHVEPAALREQVKWHARGTLAECAEVHVEKPEADLGDPDGDQIRLVAVDIGT